MKKIVYTNAAGSTCIVNPSPTSENEDERIDRLLLKDVPKDALNVAVIDSALIPADRTFRKALKHDMTYDIDKARDVVREKLAAKGKPVDDQELAKASSIDDLVAAFPDVKERLK